MDPSPYPSKLADPFTTRHPGERRSVNTAALTKHAPYLGRGARLSQVWFNKWTVLILLVLCHFLITIASLNSGLGDAKVKALSACTKVEDIGSSMASMPHYLSKGVNSLAASGITKSVHALMTVLDLILSGVESLITFAIHMFTDTYVCLLQLAVTGGLNATAAAIEGATDGLNKAISAFSDNVDKAIGPLQSAIDGVYKVANGVGDTVGAGTSAIGNGAGQATSIVGGIIGGLIPRDSDRATVVLLRADATDLLRSSTSATATAAFPRGTEALEMIAERSELRIEAIPSTVIASGPAQPTEESLPTITSFAQDLEPRNLEPREFNTPDISKSLSGPIDDLKAFKLNASGVVGDINELRDKVPTFDEIRKKTDDTIGIPFDMVRKALNDSYGGWKFDDTVFPLAAKESLSFCSDNSVLNDFFESLFKLVATAKIVAICLLCLLAVLAMGWFAYLEFRRARKEKEYIATFQEQQHDIVDFAHLYSNPRLGYVSVGISKKIIKNDKDAKKRMLVRWCISYATSLPALFVLSIAIAGLFSCFCQWLLLQAIEKKVPELTAQVGDFAEDVVYQLGNVSERWANDANRVIGNFSTDINDDILGKVTNATSAANDTLNVLIDGMNDSLTFAFGGTFLENPVKDVVRCLVGLKIESVQKGLTWVHDHAHVDFPMFPTDVFSLGAAKSIDGDSDLTTFLASPSSVTTDEVTDAVVHVTDWLYNNIITDLLIAIALLLVWVLVVVIGVAYTLFAMFSKEDGTTSLGDVQTGKGVEHQGHTRSSSAASYGHANSGQYDEKYGGRYSN